ncbi:MAG TPA: hypothetical protein VMI11_03420 [Actinomycetes bacterium]|nr:hypothetical protein [Actinomycetes bacterium]
MIRVIILNVTPGGERKDGTADYRAVVDVNYKNVWAGEVKGHVRAERAPALLRRLADAMEGRG